MSKKDYFSVGKIIGTRGIKGELKVESWTDCLEDFCLIKKIFISLDDSPLDISEMRIHKSHVLMKLNSIDDRNAAESFVGKILYSYREDIPLDKDRYFIEDLKGCNVIDCNTDKIYGVLKDVMNTGASDIYVIVDDSGNEYLVPIIEGTVKNIDLELNQIHINPIRGVFDDN